MYRCSSPENLVSSSPAICERLKTFRSASTPPESRGGRLPRRCFLAWCTQFQITHVFLEAVKMLCPSIDFKTCESLFDVAPRAWRLHKNTPSPRVDASSFSRVNPLRRRMNRRPLLESAFFAAAPPRAFSRAPHSFDARRTGEDGSTPFWRKAGTSLFTYKSRAWRMRYAQAQFQLVKCASRRGSSGAS